MAWVISSGGPVIATSWSWPRHPAGTDPVGARATPSPSASSTAGAYAEGIVRELVPRRPARSRFAPDAFERQRLPRSARPIAVRASVPLYSSCRRNRWSASRSAAWPSRRTPSVWTLSRPRQRSLRTAPPSASPSARARLRARCRRGPNLGPGPPSSEFQSVPRPIGHLELVDDVLEALREGLARCRGSRWRRLPGNGLSRGPAIPCPNMPPVSLM